MKKICLLFTAILMFGISSYAQGIKVSGKVTDASSGEGIPFASVVVKGTMTGVSTDAEGEYTVQASKDAVLVFSFVGYETLEVPVNGRTAINVSLSTDDQLLDETIVVAYGTATKSSFTGSASVVKSETISNHVSSSVTTSLAGTTPGVQVVSSTGDPASGGSATIRIRGIGSMSASSAPLVVLDGMPYSGALSDINPNDVESMSVLKDASAAAIYGARGANGVILITTKKASAGGDAVVKFDAKWGSNSRLIPQYDVIKDPGQYYETHYRMMYNSQIYAGKSQAEAYAYADKYLLDDKNGGLGYLVYTVPKGEKLIGTNFKLNPNATLGYSDGEYYYTPDDWYDETFHSSFRHEYNLSVSGGSNRFTYYASAGYLDDKGIVNNSEYKRYTIRVNADYQAKKWLKVISNLSYSHSDSQTPQYSSGYGSSGNIFYITNTIGPIYPLYVRNADGTLKYESGRKVYDSNNTNFIRPSIVGNAVRDNEYNEDKSYADVLTGKGGLVLTPVKGLTLTANIGFLSDNTRYNGLASVFGSATSVDGAAAVAHYRTFSVNNQYLAEYKTDFGGSDHNFNILVGYERYAYKYQYLYGYNDHLFNPFIGELNNADGADNKSVSSYTTNYMTMGILSRLQYDYAGKYFVSASYRRDQSSRFAKGHRWGNFGSVGLAWLINKEGFMADASWIDMLKLKASYGAQGNDNLGSYFPYADQYTHSYNPGTGEYSLNLSYKGNEDLTWETSHSVNVGLDFDLFRGYLNGSVEFFDKITSNLLYNKDVPLSSGNPTGYMPVNVGSISNMGVEVTLGGNIINTRKVNWAWNLNLSHYKNKIRSLDPSVEENGIKGGNYIYKVGGTLYQAYMRKYAGVDKETGKALWYFENTDEDGNTFTDITDVFTKASQYDCGSVLPKLYGGFGMTLNAYGFDLSVQLAFQLGGQYYDGTYQALMHTSNSTGQAWHKDVLKSWSEDNRDSNIPRLDGDTSVGQTACDCYLISSNYLSVNNVTLGYSLPAKALKKIKLAGLRFYVSGENLGVATARQGVDPRYSLGLGSYTSGSGLNSGAYSAMRNITGGVTLTF
ncbi:MAG: SusC/RagA family TonB-linked outer membrane protein [Candidatus Cryptobacteroides sp.]